jgi:hypothetical protein
VCPNLVEFRSAATTTSELMMTQFEDSFTERTYHGLPKSSLVAEST